MKDIETQVCEDILERQKIGIPKYGGTLAESKEGLRAWLQHALTEGYDQVLYLKRAIAEIDEREQPDPNEITGDDLAALEKAAGSCNESLSTWARRVLLAAAGRPQPDYSADHQYGLADRAMTVELLTRTNEARHKWMKEADEWKKHFVVMLALADKLDAKDRAS